VTIAENPYFAEHIHLPAFANSRIRSPMQEQTTDRSRLLLLDLIGKVEEQMDDLQGFASSEHLNEIVLGVVRQWRPYLATMRAEAEKN
jgi:hypothetical protein